MRKNGREDDDRRTKATGEATTSPRNVAWGPHERFGLNILNLGQPMFPFYLHTITFLLSPFPILNFGSLDNKTTT
ncbi:MAG: hypothetical protein SPI30_05235 [Prevotella sp.]|nr:hypothetical protein [Prevotella sp.]